MTTYKWLTPDHRGAYGHGDYTAYLPHGTRPGKWLPVVADPRPCKRGYHVVGIAHLPAHWGIPGVLYEAETRGKTVANEDKAAWAQIRLVRRVGSITPEIAVAFAADCAEHVLPIFEAKFPNDNRPRAAIEAARACIADPTPENRVAAENAYNAATAAARAATAAARAATAATWAAATAAATAATWVAAWAATAATWAAAEAAAWATGAAAWAAEAAEREWQGAHLIELLEAAR